MLFYISLLLLIVLYMVNQKWRRIKEYWTVRGVPSQPPHPLFGSMGFMVKQQMLEYLIQEYKRFKPNPYFGMWLFWQPALVVCDPEIARRILIKDFEVFKDRYIAGGSFDNIGRLNVFALDDPLWSSIRKRITLVFTAAKLRALHPLKLKKAKELVQRIKNDTKQKKLISLRDMYADYTTDIIGAAAFGVDGDATLTGESPMREITKDFATFTVWRAIGFTSMFFLPSFIDIIRVPFFPKAATDYFRKVYSEVVKQRGGWEKERDTKDLLDALLKMKRDAKADGEDMDDEILIAQAAIFLQAGFDTSGVALAFTTYELAHAPEIQEKLYQAVKEAKDKMEGNDFDSKALSEITYLSCVIKETLRKYPAMGWLDRVASRDYKIDDNLTIPAGMPVYVNAAAMQYDDEYFPDPLKYVPERFLPENEANIKPFTYMPFGEGPRNCVGLRFGRQTLAYAISHIILEFELKPLPGYPLPKDVHFNRKSVFLSPGIKLSCEFVPRNP